MVKREKVTITYERTVQIAPYTPLKVAISTTLVNDSNCQIFDSDITAEYKTLQEFCDNALSAKLAEIE